MKGSLGPDLFSKLPLGVFVLQGYDKELLVLVASKAGLRGQARTSTAKLSVILGCSQQTVSRKLRELKEVGLVELAAEPSGCTLSLTDKGVEELKADFVFLKRLFEARKAKAVSGVVKNGLGEGKYYVSRPAYLSQFRKLLGFKPFFGTLNLAVDAEALDSFLFGAPPVNVQGFSTDERSFGDIRAYSVLVEGKQPSALIFPERTNHPKNEVEVISPVNLRKKFKLKEGSRVSFSLC